MKLAGQVAIVTGGGPRHRPGRGPGLRARGRGGGPRRALRARAGPGRAGDRRCRRSGLHRAHRRERRDRPSTRWSGARWPSRAGSTSWSRRPAWPASDRRPDAKPAEWDEMLAVNLRGAMLCCRAVLPAMMAQRRGTIVNIGSVVTSRVLAGSAAYTASKYGLLGFSRVLAEEMRASRGQGGGAVGGRHRHPAVERGLEPARPGAHAEAGAGGGGGTGHGPDRAQRDAGGDDAPAGGGRALTAPVGRPGASAIISAWARPAPITEYAKGGANDHVERDGRQEDRGSATRGRQARVESPDPRGRRRLLRHVL